MTHLKEDSLYRVTLKNRQVVKMTGNCLIQGYMNNSSNSDSVETYEVIPGTWYDVKLGAAKMWAVYAESADKAIRQNGVVRKNGNNHFRLRDWLHFRVGIC